MWPLVFVVLLVLFGCFVGWVFLGLGQLILARVPWIVLGAADEHLANVRRLVEHLFVRGFQRFYDARQID